MPAGPPGDPQLEGPLEEPWRSQVTALRRYVRRARDTRVADLLSRALDAAGSGDTDAAYRHITAAGLLAGDALAGPPAGPGTTGARVAVPRPRAAAPAPSPPRRAATIIRKPLTGRALATAAGPAGPAPVLVATDGSSSGDGCHCSWAFIATSGHWGCQAGDYRRDNVNGRSGALIAELRAAHLALRCVAGPVTLLTDSTIALRYLRAWQHGATGRMPPQYDLHPRRAGAAPALVTLAELVSSRRDELTFAHVKGHAGHTLNEGADLLATIARRWVAATDAPPADALPAGTPPAGTRPRQTPPQEAMRAEAADIAATFLSQWRHENPRPPRA